MEMKAETLRLILGDQLNRQHSWFEKKQDDVLYVLMELRQETDYVRHHLQKVLAFFAAMREFAAELESQGHHVLYLQLDDPENSGTLDDNLARLIQKYNIRRFEYMMPDEYRLDQQLENFCRSLNIEMRAVDTQHFLSARHDVKKHFKDKKQYLMESFYRKMRRQYNILMDDDQPIGERWNFDAENRNRYDESVPIPKPLLFDNDVSDLLTLLQKHKVATMGSADACLMWPINREQSLELLNHFVDNALSHFGTFQDAMAEGHWTLFHSRLSFALNTKMLHPLQVISAAISAWEKNKKAISLAQIEGFVRQILGWREYMRGMYWALMPDFADLNFFEHDGALPHYYWDGQTKMNCLQQAIQQSLDKAYAHHIQRLMITGNFALLAGVHPDHVDAWYLGVYVDAIEWVEITNTRGMSQFADGGQIATKPYVSSANYIHKMSDYCKSCHYNHKKKTGERACPFNSLYWHFYDRHREKLEKNPRVGMMYRTWDRMDDSKKKDIVEQADKYLEHIQEL